MLAHFVPLLWCVCLLGKRMNGLEFFGQALVHQSVAIQQALPLKLGRDYHCFKALATPTGSVFNFLHKHTVQFIVLS